MKTAYFLLSRMLGDEWSGLGHLRDGSSLISVKIWSTGIINGVNFSGQGFLSSLLLFPSSFRRSTRSLFCPLRSSSFSFFFSLVLSTPSMAAKASSAFMYFYAFNNASGIVLGGFLAREAIKSLDFNPALKVVSCTLLSVSSTSSIPRVKHVT